MMTDRETADILDDARAREQWKRRGEPNDPQDESDDEIECRDCGELLDADDVEAGYERCGSCRGCDNKETTDVDA